MQVLNEFFQPIEESDKIYYNNFIYSYKTEITRKHSLSVLKYFMKFLNVTALRELVENKPQKIIEADIKAYLVYLRNEKKIAHTTAVLYLAVIKKFYIVNTDFSFKWNLISMYLGNDDTDDYDDDNVNINEIDDDGEEDEQQQNGDRPYTKTEIQKMFNSAQDIRVKLIISLMSSSGLRNGAVNLLKIRDLEKIEKYNIYQITAYRKSKKYSYKTFCTPECTALIDSYLEYRKNQGEVLKGSSPLIREQFNTLDKLKVNNPRHLTPRSIRNMINDVLIKYSSLRKKLPYDRVNNRKEGRNATKLTHGMRKFFTVECTKAGVYHEIVEKLCGHKIPGSRQHYLIFNPQTLLEGTAECKGYMSAINELTINEENRLSRQVQELKEKDDYQQYIIDKKLQEKDEQIKILMFKIDKLSEKEQQFDEIQNEGRIIIRDLNNQLIELGKQFDELTARLDIKEEKEKEKEK